MKPFVHKHLLSIASVLVTGIAMAQSANHTIKPFKEIQRKQFTDNFTAREIKKKELEIAPSQIVFLNTAGNLPIKEGDKYTEKKKVDPK